jgi:hypothetical protein
MFIEKKVPLFVTVGDFIDALHTTMTFFVEKITLEKIHYAVFNFFVTLICNEKYELLNKIIITCNIKLVNLNSKERFDVLRKLKRELQ